MNNIIQQHKAPVNSKKLKRKVKFEKTILDKFPIFVYNLVTKNFILTGE